MLRITRLNPGEQPPTLKLEGRLAGPWVPELERVVALSANGAGRVVLDLASLTFADDDGVTLLRALDATGAELRGGSPFVVTLLRSTSHDHP